MTLKIGIFVQQFPVPSETFIVTKVLGLLEAGLDVRIFAQQPSPHWGRFAELTDHPDLRERVHIAPPTRPAWKIVTVGLIDLLAKLWRHPAATRRYLRHCWAHRQTHPLGLLKALYARAQFIGHDDLDLLHIEFDAQGVSVADMAAYLGCKLLLSRRITYGLTSLPDRFPTAPEWLFQYASAYHVLSDYLRREVRGQGLPDDIPIAIIPPAADLTLFTPGDRRTKPVGSPLQIVSVARLVWVKGYEFALDAVARLVSAGVNIEYTIVGEGDYREALEFAAHQHGLIESGMVRFVGAVPRRDVPRYYQAADVMLHLALHEGFCNAVIEAQAMGVPVVASDAGGLPENVADGVTGFIVPRRDSAAAAEKLLELAADPALRQRMGAAGRERAAQAFDLSQQIAAFVALYRDMTGE